MDLRMKEWREAITEIANAIENCPLTNRALALLIADSCSLSLTQVLKVLEAIPKLEKKYLKKEFKKGI
jgi:hypothetical protein